MTAATDYTLAELCIVAASQAFENDGEVLATGIGVIPRLAASLAMKTTNPDLMMTDSEAWMLSEPNPLGKRPADFVPARETWMGFSRIFDNVWSGRRHAMLGPTQIDRFGQSNTSALGGTYEQPKVMMLGARGFPGNSISHPNSFFVPSHNTRVFMDGECDFVSSIGYNPDRLPKGHSLDDIDIRPIDHLAIVNHSFWYMVEPVLDERLGSVDAVAVDVADSHDVTELGELLAESVRAVGDSGTLVPTASTTDHPNSRAVVRVSESGGST